MINGMHVVLYSSNPDADRAFFKDILKLPNVDAGDGWLIFAMPPAELAVHPAEPGGQQEVYLLTDNLDNFIAEMSGHGIKCSSAAEQSWGMVTQVTLPGGGILGVYEPHHKRPVPAAIS